MNQIQVYTMKKGKEYKAEKGAMAALQSQPICHCNSNVVNGHTQIKVVYGGM